MSDNPAFDRIKQNVSDDDVVLFMKGTPVFPQCGFSSTVVQVLTHMGVQFKGIDVLADPGAARRHQILQQLANHSAALCQRRIRRRLRHHPRNV